MVVFPVSLAFVVGGLGFPVLVELRRRVSPHRWSLHMRITLAATAVMLLIGPLTVLVFEWNNPATLSSFDIWEKLQAAWFQGVTPRTAGFNTVDIGELEPQTLLTTTGLMFIGAPRRGGLLHPGRPSRRRARAPLSVVRGDDDVTAARRRIPVDVIRQAMAVAFLASALVFGGTLALISMADFEFLDTAFEVTSAFGTVGLSTGLTSALPGSAQLLLVVIMVAGRVGPITFVAALTLRQRTRTYRYARERPIIG